ncbi:L-lactate permease [Silvanigrella sp.]|uniref:L-lactate permease n=1 Tax=Silvanigrella sp. TaxID=2024976 RepID=UPI0037C4FDC0
MLFFLSLSPLLVCILIIFYFKKSASFSAVISIIYSFILIFSYSKFNINQVTLTSAFSVSIIITLTVAFVIIPGLYFNEILNKQGILKSLVSSIKNFPLDNEKKSLILILGILPALESFTGFGISLLLGIPIFFKLYSPMQAFQLSMLSLNTIPWGTLGISTVIGSKLTGYSIHDIGKMSSLISFLIFPFIGMMTLYIIGKYDLIKRKWFIGLGQGFLFATLLFSFNYFGLTEIAGILTGVITSLIMLLFFYFSEKNKLEFILKIKEVSKFIFPYVLLLIVIITFRIPFIYNYLENIMKIQNQNISFNPFISPGFSLFITSLILFLIKPISIDSKMIFVKTKIAISSLFMFILLARIMFESNMVTEISNTLQNWDAGIIKIIILPLFGMISGFITGSNVGGNVLIMNVQQKIGESLGNGLLFSAVQNSSAGHVIFTSLPIIILIMTIANSSFKYKNEIIIKEKDLLYFGLKMALFIYCSILITTILLYYFI